MDPQYSDMEYRELASRASHAAAVMGSGPDFFLAHLVDGSVCSADATAAALLGYKLCGLVALTEDGLVAKFEPGSLVTVCRAVDYFEQSLKAAPVGELARLELERLYLMEDPRP